MRVGGRQTDSQYQFTLWSSDIEELQKQVSTVLERVKHVPGVVDVTTDRDQGGLQLNINIDRQAASRLGVRVQDIDNALNNSFSQRQISTIYGDRNQYRVILEVDRQYKRDPSDLTRVYVPGNGDAQVPLSAVTRMERGNIPLLVGGTGFYYRELTRGLFPGPGADDRLRARLNRIADKRGVERLHTLLARVDGSSAARIMPRYRT